MTQQHPITPPSELLQLWFEQHHDYDKGINELLIEAAQYGADQELEACCEWLSVPCPSYGRELRNARRLKRPSLKEQALETLKYPKDFWSEAEVDTIRRALESINE
jgi:hypothetical protein